MLPTINEFWERCFDMDESGDYINPSWVKASKQLKTEIRSGVGSKGGGYVLVCPYCGYAQYTHDKRRIYCSTKCRNQAFRQAYKRVINGTDDERRKATRSCQFCGKTFIVAKSVVRKGGGIFCCRDCSSRARGLTPISYICNKCGMVHKTVWKINAPFCSIECMRESPRTDNSNFIINYAPQRLNEDDALLEDINERIDQMIIVDRRKHSTEKDYLIDAITTEMRDTFYKEIMIAVKNRRQVS